MGDAAGSRRVEARAWFLGSLLLTLIGLTLLVGWLDGGRPALAPTYCAHIGDDNCDGVIRPDESGWKCVPPSGGPLLC